MELPPAPGPAPQEVGLEGVLPLPLSSLLLYAVFLSLPSTCVCSFLLTNPDAIFLFFFFFIENSVQGPSCLGFISLSKLPSKRSFPISLHRS